MSGGQHRWPDIRRQDRRAVDRALRRSTWGVHCEEVQALRSALARYCHADHALLTDSGTSATVCGLASLGVGPGTEVITSVHSFAASGMAILLLGATPVWCDVRPDTGTIDPAQVEAAISPRTRAILPVATHGILCDTAKILAIAKRHDLSVLWDICQAIGSRDELGRVAGSLPDCSALSANVTKPWQCGEGGALLSEKADIHDFAALYACFGEERPSLGHNETRGYWSRYLGTNARMAPHTAALGRSQLARVPVYIERARRNLAILTDGLRTIPGVCVVREPPGAVATPWHPRIVLDPWAYGWETDPREFRDRIVSALRARGLSVDTWQRWPLPALPPFRGRGFPAHVGMASPPLGPWTPSRYPNATRLLDNSLTVGMYPYPLYVQPKRVMRRYVEAFGEIFANPGRVLSGPFEAVKPMPSIPSGDL